MNRQEARSRWWIIPVAIVLAALLMGLPSLRGGFLAGDDIRFVRDHVLVNRPSIAHAIRLFAPDANGDLYQPIPLLTFAADFAAVRATGLTARADGPRTGLWLFHLTNVLLHAANALLVWWLLSSVSENRYVPVVAALLFAVHPLNVEAVAWLNGRMTLLATLFALAALIAWNAWLTDKRWRSAALCLTLGGLAMMSKVSIGLPVLMLLLMVYRRVRPSRVSAAVWAFASAITALFALVNLRMSQGVLDSGAETLEGSGLVRGILALGWYIRHYVVPTGLAAWHPAPNPATWSDPALPWAGLVVVAAVAATIVSLRWTRLGVVGALWFLASIAATLPLLPSRNLLVAERYMYLPAIGLHWIAAAGVVWLVAAARRHKGRRVAVIAGGLWIACLIALLILDRSYAHTYRTDIDRALRIAATHSDAASVWVKVADAYYEAGRYEDALRAAQRETARYPEMETGEAGRVMGMALCRLGRVSEGVATLERIVAAKPTDLRSLVRLAGLYHELKRYDEAVALYARVVQQAPNYNPAWLAMGALYRKLEQPERARDAFTHVLTNNPYDTVARTALTEIDVEVVLDDLAAGRPASAVDETDRMLRVSGPDSADASARLLAALEGYSADHPRDPFPIYIASMLLVHQGRLDAARQGIETFKSLCGDPAWRQRADALLARAASSKPSQ